MILRENSDETPLTRGPFGSIAFSNRFHRFLLGSCQITVHWVLELFRKVFYKNTKTRFKFNAVFLRFVRLRDLRHSHPILSPFVRSSFLTMLHRCPVVHLYPFTGFRTTAAFNAQSAEEIGKYPFRKLHVEQMC